MMSDKTIWTTVVCIGVMLVCIFKFRDIRGSDKQMEKHSKIIKNHSVNSPSPIIGFKEILKDKDGSLSKDLEHGLDLEPFKMVSQNEQMIKLTAYLAHNRHLVQHPDVKISNNLKGGDILYFKGEKIFSAPYIYYASVSKNNIMAVETITETTYPSYKNPTIDFDKKEQFFPVSYGEIWIIKPNEKPYKISSHRLNTSKPAISGNGLKVAFTANELDQTNSQLNEFLVVYDLETEIAEHYNTSNMKRDHYKVSPVMWINDTVLRTVEDWGETGGNGEVGYIDFR